MDDNNTGSQILKSPEEIYGLLKNLQKTHNPITIKFEDGDQLYSSIMLKTDLTGTYFILDEITPPSGHKRACAGDAFSIRASHQGINLYIRKNKVAGYNTQADSAFYKINFPDEMVYQQRRNAFRVPVSRSMNTHITFTSEDRETPITGRILDMSFTGCKVVFTEIISPGFKPSEHFENCVISMDDKDTIECAAEARHAIPNEEYEVTTVGFRFLNLQGMVQRNINKLVQNLQRIAARSDPSNNE